MNLNKENMKNIMFLIIFTLVLAACIFNLDLVFKYIGVFFAVITPFIIGCVMAFLVNIPMKFIENKLFYNKYMASKKFTKNAARPVSLILALLFLVGVVAFVVGIVVPDLYVTIIAVSKNITDFLPKVYYFVSRYINNDIVENYIYKLQQFDWLSILNDAMKVFTSGAGNVISSTIGVISSVMNTTVNIFIAFVFCIYVLLEKETLSENIKLVLKVFLKEKHFNFVYYVSELTYKTFSSYVTGQCLDAFILGLMVFAVLVIANLPYPMLIGILIGFTALIPLVGSFIGCAISVFLIFMISPTQSIIFIIIFLILQQVEGNLIYPKVVGESVGLPPIFVLMAVTIGGSLWGVIGMIVFIPLSSVFYTLLSQLVHSRLNNMVEESE